MRRRQFMPLALATGALLASGQGAGAFPDKPIVLVTGYSPGGSTDILARLLADRLAAHIGGGARIVVENRPGAAGTIASEWLRRQPADGHVLMVAESGSHAIAPNALIGGTRYHPVTDFTHLGVLSTGPLLLVVNNAFPARTAPEAIAHLRTAPPGTLNYATSGFGGVLHLATEMLGQELGTRFVHVPYRSGGLMLQSIHTGETQFGIAAIASAFAMVRDGMVRPIAVTGAERFPLYPDIPTLMESGVPGFDIGGWYVLLGPAGMPEPIAETINSALNAALAEEPLRERMLGSGLNPWRGPNGLAEARAFMVRELEKHRVIVERTGVRLQP
ncbi:Bug family tripartite tricarboxylate transporter substrate binding protein [Caldovatus aquaticus]|uniref:Tripartite tricarboxylate transporter substrate binding protein n=1 Tax=Caldovatus aquaticus TaxID=2865671 RepID=A0ABS7F279_9PROT|nr:tripartite tricarboxylate transporter substrate binding protein [Caldovatus aquaticus]MBW8269092.1 tripartite tricarboxylate transporter substrate binding protein [Caldovatus aquaticus]